MGEKIYSSQEVADLKQVSRKTVTDWIKSGYLPGAKKTGPGINSPYKIPQSALDHFDSLVDQPSS